MPGFASEKSKNIRPRSIFENKNSALHYVRAVESYQYTTDKKVAMHIPVWERAIHWNQ